MLWLYIVGDLLVDIRTDQNKVVEIIGPNNNKIKINNKLIMIINNNK